MEHIRPAIVTLLMLLLSGLALAETPEQLYTQMYAKNESMVRSTRDFADDLAFAEQLISASKQLKGNKALSALMCEKAASLAGRRPEGLEIATQAHQRRMKLDPTQTRDALKQIVQLHNNAYRRARGAARPAAGQRLIDEQVKAARQYEKIKEHGEAASLYRRAAGIARALKSPQLDALTEHAERASDLANALRTAESLKSRVQRNAGDTGAYRELAMIYLGELTNYKQAVTHAEKSGDQQLATIAKLHTKGIGNLEKDEAVTLADWCTATANERPSKVAKVQFLSRAKLAYERFLSVHRTSDVDRLRASTALADVKSNLGKLKPTRIKTTRTGSSVATNPNTPKVKGMLYAAGDYYLTLRINGKTVCQGNYSTLCSAEVELKDGDIITAHVRYYDEDFYDGTLGFWCMFVAEDGRRNSFMTNTKQWRVYSPANERNWSEVNPKGRHSAPVIARPFPVKLSQVIRQAPGINSVDALRGALLWGRASGADTYFFHQVKIR